MSRSRSSRPRVFLPILILAVLLVLGLVAAAIALRVSAIRKSWYAKYMSAFEAAAECVLETANNVSAEDGLGAAASSGTPYEPIAFGGGAR